MNEARLLAGLVGGALACALVWRAGRDWLTAGPLLRENYAGRQVPVAGGTAIVLAALAVQAGIAVWRLAAVGEVARLRVATVELPALALTAGFGFLGLLDDLLGSGGDRGFRGHVRAARRGRLTTGLAKLLGGGAVAAVVVAPRARDWVWLLVGAALVALSANLANLLDRAPGRLLKASGLAGVPLLVSGHGEAAAAAVAPPLGAAWALLPADLGERTMLGDVGANVVGASLGYLAVEVSGRTTELVLLGLVLGANLLSELVSFSRVVDAVPPLRWLDRAGRRPPAGS